MAKFGIKETLEVIELVKDLADAVHASKADGKLDVFDMVHFLKITPSIFNAVRGSSEIKLELSDLNDEEKEILLKAVQEAILKIVTALT